MLGNSQLNSVGGKWSVGHVLGQYWVRSGPVDLQCEIHGTSVISYRLAVSVTDISLVPGHPNEHVGPVSRKANARNVVDVMKRLGLTVN